MAAMVKKDNVQRVKASPWAIMADETTDKANREQLVLVVHYLSKEGKGFVIREDPERLLDVLSDIRKIQNLHVADAEVRLTGENLGSVMLHELECLGLDTSTLVAQCYDGAASMCSERVGVVAKIKEVASNAEYFHCVNHGLNLATSQIVKVDILRNAQGVLQEAIHWLFDRQCKKWGLTDVSQENN